MHMAYRYGVSVGWSMLRKQYLLFSEVYQLYLDGSDIHVDVYPRIQLEIYT